ncbi:ribbon-helix-helix protein, CopG family [Acetobacter persici]
MLAGRVPAEMIAAIEEWAERHNVSRSEAVRRLILLGLEAEQKLS